MLVLCTNICGLPAASNGNPKCRSKIVAIAFVAAQVIGRSAGRSSVAAAAYRAGTKLTDERTGEIHDFTRRAGVRESFILAPAEAPAWMKDHASLWNGVETAEKRKDAQLARELVVALPHELDATARRKLLVDFVQAEFVNEGMVADVAIHAPDHKGDQRNEHAHIMLTMRVIEGDGFGKKATVWNSRELLEQWKNHWADRVNAALEQAQLDARIDARSPEVQAVAAGHDVALANLATLHLGPALSRLERRGVSTERGDLNREVKVINLELEKARRELAAARSAVPKELPPAAPKQEPPVESLGDRLRRELVETLALPSTSNASEARREIQRQRDALASLGSRRITENEALTDASRRRESARRELKKLSQRREELQQRGRELAKVSKQNTAAIKWQKAHPVLSWLHAHTPLKFKAATLAAEPTKLKEQWQEAKVQNQQVQASISEQQQAMETARVEFWKLNQDTRAAAEVEAKEIAQRLDHAEALANDLQQQEQQEAAARLEAERQAPPAPEAAPAPRLTPREILQKYTLRPGGPRPS